TLFSPTVSFASIFNLRLLHGLPLHIRGIINTATFERNDVINDVAFPASWIARAPHEVCTCRRASLILPLLPRFATVDFFGTDDFRERVELVLGFDVLRE